MRIGLVFDVREDYGLETSDATFCDFNYLSDMQYLLNSPVTMSCPLGHPIALPVCFARIN